MKEHIKLLKEISVWLVNASKTREITKEEVLTLSESLEMISEKLEKELQTPKLQEMPRLRRNQGVVQEEDIKKEYRLREPDQEFINPSRIVRPSSIRTEQQYEPANQGLVQKFMTMKGWQKVVVVLLFLISLYIANTQFEIF